jgi:chlorite dismutase
VRLIEKWSKYHAKNPDFYVMFSRYAYEAIEAGHKKLSPWLIANRIRWESLISITKTDTYKVPNDYISIYSRKFIKDNPSHGDFFSCRPMKNVTSAELDKVL